MATLHLIHGFVGVGKTTFAKKLESESENTVRFTLDEWMIALFGQNPTKEEFVEFEPKIKVLIWKTVEQLLKNGTDIILDYGFWKRAERDDYKNLGKNLGIMVKLYNLQCDDDVIRERVEKRTQKMEHGALFIDENALDEFKQYFEPIVEDEKATLINNLP